MSFNETAAQIVKESIKTAYSVDDNIVEPFSNDEDPGTWKKLYTSFRENGCSLELAKFRDMECWDQKQKTFLNSKDLLILDWELKNGDHAFIDSLSILSQAVSSHFVPFICIYTQTEDLESIIFNIVSYLWEYAIPSDWELTTDLFYEQIDFDSFDIDEDRWEQILVKSREVFLYPNRQETIRKEIQGEIFKLAGTESEFRTVIRDRCRETFGRRFIEENLAILEFMNGNYVRRTHDNCSFPIMAIECDHPYSLLINNTIVVLAKKDNNKDGVAPDSLYERLADALSYRPNNFLSLFGLEYRNLMKKESIAFGSSLNSIGENSFFYYQESLKNNPDGSVVFDFFLKDLWEIQLGGHWHNYDSPLLNTADEYKDQKGINETIDKLKQSPNENLHKDLISLNIHTSIISYEPKHRKLIRFGDIYAIEGEKRYLLCITPHCDCWNPSKMNNGFVFVEGSPMNPNSALKKTDERFVSFMKIDRDFHCINWASDLRPYTIYIEPHLVDFMKPMVVNHKQTDISIKYLCTQKENYTQRIANQSMSFANRVGLSYASIFTSK